MEKMVRHFRIYLRNELAIAIKNEATILSMTLRHNRTPSMESNSGYSDSSNTSVSSRDILSDSDVD